jgi:ABC-type amino acid transport substrate-binding protein
MKRFLPVFFTCFLYMAGSHWSARSSAVPNIYFYNPETNVNNFATLKAAFDTYLLSHGGYYFQPFENKEKFEAVIHENKGDIYLLSNWHLKALQQKNVPLKVALVGMSKGQAMQRKVLSAKKDITNVTMLKNTVIAGAGSEEYIYSVLKQIFGKEQEPLLKDIKILIVPKDIDAIMAVGFGMASAAISAESSLDKLAMINPNQFKELHGLGFSEKDYLLVAATLKKPEQQEAQLLEVLRKMSEGSGEENLRLLGIDDWRALQ